MTDQEPPYVCHVNENIEGAVYIGRENGRKRLKRSKWANPFRLTATCDRAEAVDLFRLHMTVGEGRHHDPDELTGKPLACWCRRSDEPRTEDNMCHGDVLVELWKRHVDTRA